MIPITVWFETDYPTLNVKLVQIFILSFSLQFSVLKGAAVQNPYILAPEKPWECGKNLTLTCIFEKGTFAIEWLNGHDATLIAHCVQNVCELNPKYYGQYDISVDLQLCVFNLTVINVNIEDDSRKLMCSDGSQSDSKIIKVKDYEPLLLEDSKYGVITATSGCFSYKKEVTFKWIKKVKRSHLEEEANPKLNKNYTSGCPTCGNNEQKQYTEIINARRSQNGYNVKVIAFYGNESKESTYSVDKYILEEQVADREHTNSYLLCAILVVAAVMISILAAYLFIKRHTIQNKHIPLDTETPHLVHGKSINEVPIDIDEAHTHKKKATVSLLRKTAESDRHSEEALLVYYKGGDKHLTVSGLIGRFISMKNEEKKTTVCYSGDESQCHDSNESKLRSEENRSPKKSQCERALPVPNITAQIKKTEKNTEHGHGDESQCHDSNESKLRRWGKGSLGNSFPDKSQCEHALAVPNITAQTKKTENNTERNEKGLIESTVDLPVSTLLLQK